MKTITRDEAFTLLKKYNKDPFHIQHALTVEAVMKWYASELGYGEDAEYWGTVGLLHDIDFELYPEEHCLKAPEMLREAGVGEDVIHAVVSHGYGITSSLRHNPRRSPGTRNGKSPLRRRRTHRPYLGSCAHKTIQKHQRHGTQIPQEKIQEQRLRRRMLPRSNRTRRRTTRLGTAETADHDTAGNGRLRG